MYDYLFLFKVLTAPSHLKDAADTINCSDDRLTMIEMPPRSGKTSLATSYVKAMAGGGKTVLYISLLPEHCFYFGPESKNITVIKPLGAITGKLFDRVVVDDAIRTPDEGGDAKYIDKLVSWWGACVLTHITAGAKTVVIGSRYGEGDFMASVRPPESAICTIPAIDRYGRSYWPEMFPVERLQEIMASCGDRMFDYLYQQGSPVYETRAVARPYE